MAENDQYASRSRSRHSGQPASSSGSSGTRSAEGEHFEWTPGLVLNDQYECLRLLGDGTFGRVLLATNRRVGKQVAIKVIRDVERYTESAMIEATILAGVYRADVQGTSRCAAMYEAFMHQEKFFCLVFEPLGESLYEFLKANAFRGFWMQDIQTFSRDLMQALSFLHGQLRITHTDLKPENILLESMEPGRPDRFPRETDWLRNRPPSDIPLHAVGPYLRPASSRIKIIDFGNATRENEHHSTIINTRQYRGPEVLLAFGWDEQSDIWSAGCILMELYTGELLFQSQGDAEHLVLFTRIIGELPQRMLDGASQAVKKSYLLEDKASNQWRLAWPERPFSRSAERELRSRRSLSEHVHAHHKAFADFVASLLQLEPTRRCRAINALMSPFLQTQFED